MHETDFIAIIAQQLGIQARQVAATIKLLNEGSTVPFISRYRKELTQALDEVHIENIRLLNLKYTELVKRKLTIIDTIKEQGKLTPALEKSIVDCWDTNLLEDIYLPYKPKRKTKASIAREKGLEPLALWLLKENNNSAEIEAARYLKNGVQTEDEALQGARDIIAEIVNEDPKARNLVRNQFEKHAVVYTKVAKGKEAEGSKYQDYFKYDEPLNRCPSHRLLAVFRGEEEGFLKLNIEPDEDIAVQKLEFQFIKRNNDSSYQIELAVKDAYKRLLAPSMETEFRNLAKAKADEEAIRVFAENLKQLLLSAPLGSKRILAIDPGFRSGCKVVCLNEEGKLLADDIIYPHEPQRDAQQAIAKLTFLVEKYNIEAIAIGNGTAGRETEDLVRGINFKNEPQLFMVNENGASVYSASEVARDEFPDKDVTVRGAVSIGRRLADPLAELVKIDAKSIGVGQYQHDVDQNKLKQSLDVVVQSCVNQVGVNLNTASKSLLTYVSGLSAQTAQNIINFRNEHGAFTSRSQLKKIPRLGEKTFEQCAAFLRIPDAKNVLDNSAVHPESYGIVEQMAKQNGCKVEDLVKNEVIRKAIKPENYITETAGLLTINDILKELAKPGRDPRETLKPFTFANVKKPEDLYEGMVLPGIVTNITKFGCFVDIGVKQDGMVHISQLADKYISDPNQVVKLQQHVQVKVLEVDLARKRIGLSMKGV
ncbi:MAG: RNA-binding transcriptional accessory protein [Bacteroidia bacterium]|nr:RNA-binding transcriptional accessory protein [Bacteroidia bacterium]